MAKLKLYNLDGKSSGEIKASDEVFSVPKNEHVVNLMLNWYLAKNRQGTASAKNRDEVSGGGRKPWKQKGTGRARAGDNRSPIWRKGGVIFPPKARDFSFSIPKKVKKLSIKIVLSDKVNEGKVKVIESLDVDQPKTKEFMKIINKLKINKSALFVIDKENIDVFRASGNIPNVKVSHVNHVNVYDLLKYDEVILTKDAVSKLEERSK